ncbi:sodium:solute symporter [Tenuifilum thalassicum]|uniref:Sodium:solute symporter n=1 Tax=Tenuifilum thalassicum TaxID=2590900 RepID=A0A7D4BSK1_9BACT|nr:sodium:solute symporter [Tenuifilum thalassicum]QKG80481.1 sodium:solute symporter [Tenuifilum thalassicum]
MSISLIIGVIVSYFIVLFFISYFSSRNSNNDTFFIGNRKSPWYLVSIAMIGTSISGVTFISVPGWVLTSHFSYLQMVLGYLLGYFVVANVLLPLYYRLNLKSIYTYLETRFGFFSYKTGAALFLISRIIGAAFRLFIVSNVLQISVFNALGIPFWVTVTLTVIMIWLYTRKGGVRTVLWTDAFQALAMLLAVGLTIFFVSKELGLSFTGIVNAVTRSELSRVWFFDDVNNRFFFWKQFLSGAFITIVMTGLDQDMMQKNLSCKNFKDARKNMYWYGFAFLPVNILFLSLGVLLYMFAMQKGIAIPKLTDDLFPTIATQGYLPPIVGVLFFLGLIAAAYSSADSALTALTTSFTIDILDTNGLDEDSLRKVRQWVHVALSALMIVVIVVFNSFNDRSVIDAIFTIAGYTYGPLLGLYAFGLFTRFQVNDRLVPFIAVLSPAICFLLNKYSDILFNSYKFGFELLIVNGAIVFFLLLVTRKRGVVVGKV